MMDIVLVDGDKASFDSTFENRTLIVTAEGTIKGSGHAQIADKKVCVVGDEQSVVVENVDYTIVGYNPGKGTLTIQALQADQQSLIYSSEGKQVLLKGTKYIAMFTPTQPATSTNPPNTPDPITPTTGTGAFVNSQEFVKSV